MGIRARGNSDRLRTIWTPEMDRYFIDLMLEQVEKGNRIDDHLFSKRAWKQMTFIFNMRFNFRYEKDVMKNRLKNLRNLYKAIRHLLDWKGFSWDEMRQMVTADNEVWDDYLKAHPDAQSYRIKTVPCYHDLSRIYEYAADEGRGRGSTISNQTAIFQGNVHQLCDNVETAKCTSRTVCIEEEECGNLLGWSPRSGGNNIGVVVQPSSSGETAEEALHDITVDEDYDIDVPEGIIDAMQQHYADIFASTMTTRTRTYWQPSMDRYFVDLMLDQVKKGNQVDGLFRKRAWTQMISSFNAKFGFNYEIDILKNRYKTLRRQYNVIKNLLDLDGFVWDDIRKMVTAEDCVWQDYIKVRTDARQYMTRPVPYYKDLCVICRGVSVDGKDCMSGDFLDLHDEVADTRFNRSVKVSHSIAALVPSEDQVGNNESSSHMGAKLTLTDRKNKHQLEDPSSFAFSKKAQSKDEDMADTTRTMATAVSSSADKKTEDEKSSCIPIENVIKAIQDLPDMDEDLVLDACDFLEDEKKAKTFLALDFKLRKKWLIRKLRPEQ